jgi:hypothetical protein
VSYFLLSVWGGGDLVGRYELSRVFIRKASTVFEDPDFKDLQKMRLVLYSNVMGKKG